MSYPRVRITFSDVPHAWVDVNNLAQYTVGTGVTLSERTVSFDLELPEVHDGGKSVKRVLTFLGIASNAVALERKPLT